MVVSEKLPGQKSVTRTKKEEQTEQEEHEFFSISSSF